MFKIFPIYVFNHTFLCVGELCQTTAVSLRFSFSPLRQAGYAVRKENSGLFMAAGHTRLYRKGYTLQFFLPKEKGLSENYISETQTKHIPNTKE